jgi:hypothetical protein
MHAFSTLSWMFIVITFVGLFKISIKCTQHSEKKESS